jgi:hypothetical protein
MSLPADSASRITAGDASSASETSQPLAEKSGRGSKSVVSEGLLVAAYDKRIQSLQDSFSERGSPVSFVALSGDA